MVIDIMLTPLSMFTSSYRATVSPSRLHRGMRLVHAKLRRASGLVLADQPGGSQIHWLTSRSKST
jgi:hypothetical protein